jgi:membrane-associated phospholipid phosphatase
VQHHTLFIIIFLAYILLVTAVMIILGIPTYPDSYFFVLLIPVLFIRRTRRFILDWLPFLLLFFAYEFLRGLGGVLAPHAHYGIGFKLDSFLGGIPFPIILQQTLYQPGALHFYDYLVTIIYFMHFVTPLTFAFLLWLRNRTQFLHFTWAFLLLSYAGLITFILLPTAPPWLASEKGYIGDVHKILEATLQSFPSHFHLPTIYQNFNPNQVAAIPSLHAAFPVLIFLYALEFFGRRGLWVSLYVAAVWFSIVYLGEHYLIDAIIGAIYAIASFIIVEQSWGSERLKNWFNRIRPVKTSLKNEKPVQKLRPATPKKRSKKPDHKER